MTNLEELKSKYCGNVYNNLMVIDFCRENKTIKAICKCICGNIKSYSKNKVLSGNVKSCGCLRNKLISDSKKKWYKDNSDKAKEIHNKISQWYKDNPDKADAIKQKHHDWVISNPDRLKEIGQKHSLYYKDNPEIKKIAGDKISKWYANHPDKVKNKSLKFSNWCKNNPDKVKFISNKQKQWYKSHPDKVKELSSRLKSYYHNHREVVNNRINQYSILCKNKRVKYDLHNLLEVIHPSLINPLVNGDITSLDEIITKCPDCGNYENHKFHNVFVLNTGKFRTGNPPLCHSCKNCLTSSQYEKEILNYVNSFIEITLIQNDRSIIAPLELDLYYPEEKIAIEFNGDYWHSDKFKDKDYHYNKFKLCKEKGIILVSIFESEWKNRKEEIKEYLKDLFDGKENKLSIVGNGQINNNFPLPNRNIKLSDNYIEEHFTYKDYKVYTCGYSNIIQ